jgi:hypothetical protein
VGADIISQGVPLVGSVEIPWLAMGISDPTNSEDICKSLTTAYKHPKLNVKLNQFGLTHYTNKTKKIWDKYFSY